MEKEKKKEWISLLKTVVIVVVLGLIVRFFFFAPIVVNGPSMQPTLHTGDQIIVNKFLYHLHEPHRFDVVVFHATPKKDFIKRVIGLPGEHVAVRNETLYIDGKKVAEPFLAKRKANLAPNEVLTTDFELEDLKGGYQTIPEGYILVLGDNRSNSTDSRILGLIPMDKVVGKAGLRYWPFNKIGVLGD